MIIKNTNDFEMGIQIWIERSAIKTIWPNFKVHFEEVHGIMREIRGTATRTAAYYHTIILVSQLRQLMSTLPPPAFSICT